MHHPARVHLAAHDVGLTLPGGRVLFRDLSLSFGPERTGLVGANGVGKTLLLELLAGLRRPTAGRIVRTARVGYVPQSSPRAPHGTTEAQAPPTVAAALGVAERLARVERVLSGRAGPGDVDAVGGDWDLAERVEALLDRLGLGHLELHRPVASLSGGESTRIRLARPLLDEPELLLLDEPTNDLDGESRRALFEFLDGWPGGVVVASHDRTLLGRVDRIVELSPLGAREHGGGWAAFEAARARERAAARAELDQARAARRRVRASVQEARERRERRQARGRRSRGSGSQPRMVLEARRERSEGTAARDGEVGGRLVDAAAERVAQARARVEERDPLRVELAPSGLPPRKEVLRVEGVGWRPPGSAEPVLEGVSLRVRGPERVAVTGPNGSGKSSLLRLVMGALAPDEGQVELGVERVAWLDQSAGILGRDRSVLDALLASHPRMDPTRARWILARFLFPDEAALTPVDALSGGERMRAALACVLGGERTPELLLLDEPTNHLDLESLETVEEAVADYDGALLVVSHDPAFLEGVGVERRVRLGAGAEGAGGSPAGNLHPPPGRLHGAPGRSSG